MQPSKPGPLRRIPPLLLRPIRHAPSRLLNPVLDMGLRAFFRESIKQGELAALEGRRVCLYIRDTDLRMVLAVNGGTPVVSRDPLPADLTISGNLEEFVLLAANIEDPDTQFFQRRLSIEGDTELGLAVKNLIYSLDPDRFPPVVNRILKRLGRLIEHTRALGL